MTDKRVASVQGFVSYDLHTLGWKAFQDLCATILSEILGQTFEIFSPGNDGGRDGAFRGMWRPSSQQNFRGSFTAQCKFTSLPHEHISVKMLAEELSKARDLRKQGLADNYLIMTNLKLTGKANKAILEELKKVGIPHADIRPIAPSLEDVFVTLTAAQSNGGSR